jgi:hypothetical protein
VKLDGEYVTRFTRELLGRHGKKMELSDKWQDKQALTEIREALYSISGEAGGKDMPE